MYLTTMGKNENYADPFFQPTRKCVSFTAWKRAHCTNASQRKNYMGCSHFPALGPRLSIYSGYSDTFDRMIGETVVRCLEPEIPVDDHTTREERENVSNKLKLAASIKPTNWCVGKFPAAVISRIVSVKENLDSAAVGRDLSRTLITTERAKLLHSSFNLQIVIRA